MCGAVLDERAAKFKTAFEGETHYFCSTSCNKRLESHSKKVFKELRLIEITHWRMLVMFKREAYLLSLSMLTIGS